MKIHYRETSACIRALALLVCVTLASCSDTPMGPGAGDGHIRVNMFARTGSTSANVVASHAGATVVESVEVHRVAVVFGAVKLETAGVDQTVDWVREESRVVELDLAGGPVAAAEYDVEPGTYKEVEVSIDKLEVGNPAEDALIAQYPELSNASVVAEGIVTRSDGSSNAFVWATDLDRDLEIVIQPFLTIEEAPTEGSVSPTVIAVVILVGDWFGDGAGGLLDPTNEANRSAIESNVHGSVLAFEDPDEDGVDDS